MIESKQIGLAIQSKIVLDNVSFSLNRGQLTALLGHNGAGKSTLINILTGEQNPSRGHVECNGIDLTIWSALELARKRSVVKQKTHIPFEFTALQVVQLGRYPHQGTPRAKADRQALDQSIDITDIGSLLHQPYPTLSGGEQQRVQLARALAQIWDNREQSCLMLDEPFSNMDLASQHRMMRLLQNLAKQGTTVFIVLHDPNLAARYVNQLVILNKGKLYDQGDLHNTLNCALFENAFGITVDIISHPEKKFPIIVPH